MENTNGCGPEWMSKWKWSRLIQSKLFNWFHEASCDRHDEGYKFGGTGRRRKVCDKKFLQAMLRDSDRILSSEESPTLNVIKHLSAKAQAYTFYGLVRIGGWRHFNYVR